MLVMQLAVNRRTTPRRLRLLLDVKELKSGITTVIMAANPSNSIAIDALAPLDRFDFRMATVLE